MDAISGALLAACHSATEQGSRKDPDPTENRDNNGWRKSHQAEDAFEVQSRLAGSPLAKSGSNSTTIGAVSTWSSPLPMTSNIAGAPNTST